MSTFMAKPDQVERKWYLVDASDKTLGRLATKVADILRGKHKPSFTPHIDTGDFVIIINAEKIKLTGKKWDQKKYYRHSGYPGGIKETTYKDLVKKKPELIIEKAVKGMIPHNKLGRQVVKKLKVYAGSEHPHQAQQPEELEL
ncbi:50S ribosomal protein L13 [Iocasia frigidifontis]|uniref:Large ribosomal subunit protein uL13 n=1 Tax=Iocasia fonsfrigidae TaxID=2682810 RepID=A0A8A7KK90_9FIRM|nr:50S ribosomal protein L13 [Halocella sp. SP3-1]MTI60545.1 50S ribosomal protein L13 [Bacillota bacterium]QTL99267.1 50S ribosomal protein L13 [Iocasia fonsfrigidae]